MPQAFARMPKIITLVWGNDRLEVDDPIWIAKIVQELAQSGEPGEDFRQRLREPHSRRLERLDAALGGYVDPKAPPKQMGYQAPEQQGPVAAEALREFLGLELPVALNFTDWRGRSESRLSAVHTAFGPCWDYSMGCELRLCWMFNGYQLYANHHIGAAHFRPRDTQDSGHIERRLLNGQWVRWSFDGASTRPPVPHWSSDRRTFILTASGIQRVDLGDSDRKPEYDDREGECDAENGKPQSQGAL